MGSGRGRTSPDRREGEQDGREARDGAASAHGRWLGLGMEDAGGGGRMPAAAPNAVGDHSLYRLRRHSFRTSVGLVAVDPPYCEVGSGLRVGKYLAFPVTTGSTWRSKQ